MVKEEVMKHRQMEEQRGGSEIWPAVPKPTGEMRTKKLSEEEAFCSKLDPGNCMVREELAW